jgi:N-acetylmuramoyl-L-alanine amidase
MYNYLIYLIKVSILIFVFLGVYQLLFRSIKLFHLNRAFLLSGIILSWIIPLISIPLSPGGILVIPELIPSPGAAPSNVGQPMGATIGQMPDTDLDLPGSWSGQFPWWIIYWIGVVLFTLRAILGILHIIKIRIQNTATRNQKITYISGSQLPAFSFFRWIFLDEGKYAQSDYRMVIDHEQAHVRQMHTMDLFLAELVHILLWFNPFMIFYKKSLKECHEFLADDAVLKGGTPLADYARSHHQEALARANQKLASYFEGSSLKRRLLMAMKKEKRFVGLRYLLIIPLIGAGLLMFSCNERPTDFPTDKTNAARELVILVNPSHGGKDTGAVNQDIGLNEKDVVLAIAKELLGLDLPGIRILLTRTDDRFLMLSDRVKLAQTTGADLMLTLDINSQQAKLNSGDFLTAYNQSGKYAIQSGDLAELFNQTFRFREIASDHQPITANYVVLKHDNCPSLMLSMGNLNNPEEGSYLGNSVNQKAIAENIGKALIPLAEKLRSFRADQVTSSSTEESLNSFMFPVPAEQMLRIAEFYSLGRMHPILKINRPHPGIDINAPIGTPVLASENGVVTEISNSKARNGYGIYILIKHSNGYETFYAHLNKALVKENEVITRGQVIGEVGNTGLAIGPHVHFEIRKDGTAVDPAQFVLPLEII